MTKTGQYVRATLCAMLVLLSALPAVTQTQCFVPPISTNVLDWLSQHVCSVNGVVQNTDPCSCPTSGGSLPTLTVGEKLPYHKWTQDGTTRADSFPVQDGNGNSYVIITEANDLKTHPYHVYRSDNLSANTGWSNFPSGYWASSNTDKDGANLSVALWGCPVAGGNSTECLPYGGWIFFPSTLLTAMQNGTATPGTVQWRMFTRHWEQDSQYYPGAIPEALVYPDNTYTPETNLVFGGPSTSTQKEIANSIQAVHGYNPAVQDWESTGHVEVMYFTELYGLTRWEAWHPVAQWDSTIQTNAQAAAQVCDAAIGTYQTSGTYQGTITTTFPGIPKSGTPYTMVMTGCTDYTNITTTGDTAPLTWPVPQINLLTNPHFTIADPGGTGGWGGNSTRNWNTSGSPSFSAQTSSYSTDTALCDTDGGAPSCGVNYAMLQAGQSGGNYVCAGSQTGTCSAYSDVTLPSGMTAGNTYWIDYGVLAGIDSTSTPTSGQLTLVVDQLDSNNNVISGASVNSGALTFSNVISSSVVTDAVAAPFQCAANCGLSNEIDIPAVPQQITIASGATKLRLEIQFQPQNGVIFDATDVWLQYLP